MKGNECACGVAFPAARSALTSPIRQSTPRMLLITNPMDPISGTDAAGQELATILRPRRGNPNMVKGAPSVNPAGRPKGFGEFARQIRAVTGDGAKLIAYWNYLIDERPDSREALGASALLASYSYGKPMSSVEMRVHAQIDTATIMSLPPEVRLAAIDAQRARRALAQGAELAPNAEADADTDAIDE